MNMYASPHAAPVIPKHDSSFIEVFMVCNDDTLTHKIMPINATTTGIVPPSVDIGSMMQATIKSHVHQGAFFTISHVILLFFLSAIKVIHHLLTFG